MIIQEKRNLLNSPIFMRVKDGISLDTVAEFEDKLRICIKIEQNIFPIIIDSNGGCAYSLISLYEIIEKVNKTNKVKIATIVESKAFSCAAILLSCGTKGFRFASQNSSIMIHDVKTTYSGKTEDIKADALETERLNNLMYDILKFNSNNVNFKKIMNKNNFSDLYFGSNEALNYGLVDKIGVPTLKAKVCYSLEIE